MSAPAQPGARFTVVVCTRDRPAQLRVTLDALDRQSAGDFPILVVDQSEHADADLAAREGADPRLSVIQDSGRGLSRARNVAARATATEWLVFLDDDCVPDPDWAQALDAAMRAEPPVDLVSGHVGASEGEAASGQPQYAVFPVAEERVVAGRWVWPHEIGFGVCTAVRRAAIERLGGWDERLGPGVPDFPASDDMDFNFRLLRSGGSARLTPRARATHAQWRTPDDLVGLYRGYMASWAGFALKHARTGERLAGVWLWSYGLRDVARMAASALKHRSALRGRVAAAKLRGLAAGTRAGIRRRW